MQSHCHVFCLIRLRICIQYLPYFVLINHKSVLKKKIKITDLFGEDIRSGKEVLSSEMRNTCSLSEFQRNNEVSRTFDFLQYPDAKWMRAQQICDVTRQLRMRTDDHVTCSGVLYKGNRTSD
jgi:hypothetical protein